MYFPWCLLCFHCPLERACQLSTTSCPLNQEILSLFVPSKVYWITNHCLTGAWACLPSIHHCHALVAYQRVCPEPATFRCCCLLLLEWLLEMQRRYCAFTILSWDENLSSSFLLILPQFPILPSSIICLSCFVACIVSRIVLESPSWSPLYLYASALS